MTRDPTTRFSDRAHDYVRYRPGYPSAAYQAILHGLGDPATLVIADVGAGTGISARGIAAFGPSVVAVEPNAAMRDAAEAHPHVEWRDGTGEATGLAGGSVDLVLCAQSYHWFDADAACREFARILRPGGRLALMWNDADQSSELARGYYEIVHGCATDRRYADIDPDALPEVSAPFAPVTTATFAYEQRLDADGLVGRARSASYVPKSGPDAERVQRALRDLHALHADAEGVVSLAYTTWVFLTHSP